MNTFVEQHVTQPGTKYIHHCTYEFYGAKSNVKVTKDSILPGQTVIAHIDSLVVRTADNASAFRIGKLEWGDKEIKLNNSPILQLRSRHTKNQHVRIVLLV